MKAIAIGLSVVVLAVLGFVAGDRLGGADSSSAEGPDFSFAERVQEGLHPGSSDGAVVSARSTQPRVIYWNSKYFTIGPYGATSFWMQCPRGSKALSGYFYANKPGVALGSSFPSRGAKVGASRRPRWNFGVLNFNSSTTVRYYTGVICMRGVRD
jgi:hypothetical protein